MYKMPVLFEGNGISSSNCQFTTVQEPSPPISGTYRLFFDGKLIQVNYDYKWIDDIPYNANGWKIQEGLEHLLGLENSQKLSNSYWNRETDGRKILIYFRGMYGDLPLITADSSNLVGGISG